MTSPATHLWPGSSASAAAVLALLLVLSGCSATPAAAPDLTVSFAQSSDSENRHVLDLTVRNDGSRPLRVARLQLQTPLYAGAAPTRFDDDVRPGSATTFPVPYGAADCRPEDRPGRVVVGAADGAGVRELRVRVPAGEPILTRLHRQECRLSRLSRQVDLSFAERWVRVGDRIEGTLLLRRDRGRDAVRVVAVAGSQVFRLVVRGLPLQAPSGPGAVVELPVVVTLPECAPHQIIESKRNAVFNVTVGVGAEPLLLVQPVAGPQGKAVLAGLIADVCRAAGF